MADSVIAIHRTFGKSARGSEAEGPEVAAAEGAEGAEGGKAKCWAFRIELV